jgi:hypothetical protein
MTLGIIMAALVSTCPSRVLHMAIAGKVMLGVLGGLFGGPAGAAVGIALGHRIDSAADSGLESITCGSPQLDVQAASVMDNLGEFCRVKIATPLPAGCCALFTIRDDEGRVVGAVSEFADEDGEFGRLTEVKDGQCSCYIPYTGILAARPVPYHLILQVARIEDGSPRAVGWASFQQDLPNKGAWSRVAFISPALELLMSVAAADRPLSSAALKVIRAICEQGFGIEGAQGSELAEELKRIRSADANRERRV